MLTKNTILVRFIQLRKITPQRGKYPHYSLPHKYPLSKPYAFYVDEDLRKHLDLGTVLKYVVDDPAVKKHIEFEYGVICGNVTKYNSKKQHQTIRLADLYPDGHIGKFFKNHYHLNTHSGFCKMLYQNYLRCSHQLSQSESNAK